MDVRYKLVGNSGRFAGCEFGVGPGIHQVGRHSSNQIVLPGDGSVSRNHARITVTSTGVTVEDLRSTNGTYVNGHKISRQPAKEGDVLQFGDATFTLNKADGYQSSVSTAPCPERDCSGLIGASGVCNACGHRPQPCPKCGALNTSDARFCRFDGAALHEAPPPSSAGAGSRTLFTGNHPAGDRRPTAATSTATTEPLSEKPPVPHPAPMPGPPQIPPGTPRAPLSTLLTGPAQPPPSPRSTSTGIAQHPSPVLSSSQILGRVNFPQCSQCGANVGMQSELCPRCHSRVRRCLAGHVSGPTADECAQCDRPLLAVAERWAVFRGAGSSGWTPEAVRPPLRLAWKFRPPEGVVKWTSPVLGSGVVYAGASDGFLYAIRRGVAIWRSPLDGPIRTDFVPETCVPAFDEGKVFIGHMGRAVAAVEAATGKPLWQKDVNGLPSSPISTAMGCLFVGVTVSPHEGAVCAFGLDGSELWRYVTDSPVYSCPAYTAGSIMVTTADGSVLALQGGREIVGDRLLWRHNEQGDEFDTSVAVAKDGIYATSHAGKMLCLQPQTGEVLRRWLSPTGNFAHSSPAVGAGGTEGQVYFGADDRNIYVVSAQMAQTITAHSTGGVVLGSPAISDDIAYVGSQDGGLYAIGPGCHRAEAAYKLSAGLHITSSPAVGNGLVVFAGSDGYLYALEACGSG